MGHRATPEEGEKIKRNIVKKLYANQAFSKGHLLYKRLQTGIPKHIQGEIPTILHELLKKEIVLLYGKTKYGNAYQLNIKKIKEIEEIIFGA